MGRRGMVARRRVKKIQAIERMGRWAATAERGGRHGRDTERERTLLSISSSRVIRQTRVPPPRSGVVRRLVAASLQN